MSDNVPLPNAAVPQEAPQGVPQGAPHVSSHEPPLYADEEGQSTSVSEDDGFEESISMDPYAPQRRPAYCYRRRDQIIYCVQGNRGLLTCRRTVAVLAADDGHLLFDCPERGLRRTVAVSRGLHFFSYCTFNVDFGGVRTLFVPACPPLEGLPEIQISGADSAATWLQVRTTGTPYYIPAPRSLVFDLEREMPTVLACYFTGPVPVSVTFMPCPTANLSFWLPTACYHYFYITDMPAGGPLWSRAGMRIVDVDPVKPEGQS
jgi:hypothetical protein